MSKGIAQGIYNDGSASGLPVAISVDADGAIGITTGGQPPPGIIAGTVIACGQTTDGQIVPLAVDTNGVIEVTS